MELDLIKYFTKVKNLVRIISYATLFAVLITVSVFVKAEDNEYNNSLINNQENYSSVSYLNYSKAVFEQIGIASYYGKKFHNRKTASGERFNMYDLTAAHKKLPFGTIVRVTNEENGNVTFVRINDRGPFTKGRILDLSQYAAQEINGIGIPKVKIEGFDKNFLDDNSDILRDSYLAYSLNLPLEIIESRYLNFVDSTNEFKDIVQLYYDYSLVDKETNWYICVSATKIEDDPIYYLAYPKENFYFARMQN